MTNASMSNLWVSWDSLAVPNGQSSILLLVVQTIKICSVSLAVAVATRNSANLLTQQSKFAAK